ncbi:MAG TPA: holo-ACP synthase [Acidimicrobiales bacterium]|nr:holo-ACP synthase [Acidimicrobiales bacterium]
MIGVGIDLVELRRFRQVLARRPGVAGRLFTEAERGSLAARRDPVPGLAARFAAKEAAMKALGVGIGAVSFRELEVRRLESGAPRLEVSGRAAELAGRLGVESFHLSLTHTEETASAVVIAR